MRRAELGDVAKAVGKLAAEGARVLMEQRIALDSAVAQQQIGAAPSLADCVSGLQNLRCVCRPPYLQSSSCAGAFSLIASGVEPLSDAPIHPPHTRQMLADECRLHAALCAELKTDAAAGDLQAVQQLWAGARRDTPCLC